MSDHQSPRRRSWVWWLGREAAIAVGCFLAALVVTAISAFALAILLGPDDPRPEPWATVVFYIAFFGLLIGSFARDARRARRARAGGAS